MSFDRHSSRFSELLLRYGSEADSARRSALEAQLWSEFGAEKAVLVIDMSGFSRLSHQHGVVHYLALLFRMHEQAGAEISRRNGTVIKFEADNCYAVFDTPDDAVDTAVALNRHFYESNRLTPPELDITISCGIDFGQVLLIDGADFFGNPVNRASKLGEDLAGPAEVLISRDAFSQLSKPAGYDAEPVLLTIAGMSLEALKIAYPLTER